jgi:hypothetical protein
MSPRGRSEFPPGRPRRFRATVHGIVFAGRERLLAQVQPGDQLNLIPDPPGQEDPEVWVHLRSGEPLGHLPPEIGQWLAPWMLRGGGAQAEVLRASGPDVPSWRRLLLEVSCS